MNRILAIDPSGTGNTGVYFHDELNYNTDFFCEYKSDNWKEHYQFIVDVVKEQEPSIIIYEHTNYISSKTAHMTSLFKLFGAIECLTNASRFVKEINNIPVNQIKALRKRIIAGKTKVKELLFQNGVGWFHDNKKISVHQLDAFLIYYLWKKKNHE